MSHINLITVTALPCSNWRSNLSRILLPRHFEATSSVHLGARKEIGSEVGRAPLTQAGKVRLPTRFHCEVELRLSPSEFPPAKPWVQGRCSPLRLLLFFVLQSARDRKLDQRTRRPYGQVAPQGHRLTYFLQGTAMGIQWAVRTNDVTLKLRRKL